MLTREELTRNNFTGKTLYKYAPMTSWDYYFKDWTIRFTPVESFNDPFEGLPSIKYDTTTRLDREQCRSFFNGKNFYDLYAKGRKANPLPTSPNEQSEIEILKNNPDFVCRIFEQHPEIMYEIAKNGLPAIRKNVGILCLTEKHDNILMWAHYANSHDGFVIELDAQHSFFANSLVQVRYSDTRSSLSFQNIANKMFDFTTKSTHWNYEKEWRSLVFLAANYGRDFIVMEKGTVELPKNMVKNIIFGVNVNNSKMQEKIAKILQQKNCQHIGFKRMMLDDKNFSLYSENIT